MCPPLAWRAGTANDRRGHGESGGGPLLTRLRWATADSRVHSTEDGVPEYYYLWTLTRAQRGGENPTSTSSDRPQCKEARVTKAIHPMILRYGVHTYTRVLSNPCRRAARAQY